MKLGNTNHCSHSANIPSEPPRKRSKNENGNVFIVSVQSLFVHISLVAWKIDFDYSLSPPQKYTVLRHLLPQLKDPKQTTYNAVLSVASEHNIKRQRRDLLIQALELHTCNWSCSVRAADANAAGVASSSSQSVLEFHRVPPSKPPPCIRKTAATTASRSAQRENDQETDNLDKVWWAANWPQVEGPTSLLQVRTYFCLVASWSNRSSRSYASTELKRRLKL